jgi:hypothetical protein
MTRVIGKISGGVGSYSAVRRFVDRTGCDELTLVFTDTLCEDQDAYRFLIASAANLFGLERPELPEIADFPAWEDRPAYKAFIITLAHHAMRAIPGLHWLIDGRDPWDVYEAERFLGNSRIDPCSKILKRKLSDRWLVENCEPSETIIIFGIDYEEIERFDNGEGGGIRPRRAAEGWACLAPLCDLPFVSWQERVERLSAEGLWLPRLNAFGFAHNNCGGFCCKGGQGHFKLMFRVFPERYAYAERREQGFRDLLGDVSMLTDRRGGGKKPLTLRDLRARDLTPLEASDMGACGCFLGAAA